MVSFYSLFGAIQSAVVAFIAENNPNAWKLNPDIELVAIAYSVSIQNLLLIQEKSNAAQVLTFCNIV